VQRYQTTKITAKASVEWALDVKSVNSCLEGARSRLEYAQLLNLPTILNINEHMLQGWQGHRCYLWVTSASGPSPRLFRLQTRTQKTHTLQNWLLYTWRCNPCRWMCCHC